MPAPGQDPGQPFDWTDYVGWLVEQHGTLAAVADHLSAQRGHSEATETVERGLRRLRGRGSMDGGTWGRRCLRVYGLPRDIGSRVRWMGHYHSRFTDLPRSICRELLRPWDRPPVSDSAERAWVQLGLASVALRGRDEERAREHLDQARGGEGAARAEWLLVEAFLLRRHDVDPSGELSEVESLLPQLDEDDDTACLHARWIDQLGFEQNVIRRDRLAARSLYEQIPDDGPPFARVRRHNGLGWSALALGDQQQAVHHARRSVEASGDGGSLRLRAMALRLLARSLDDGGADALRRARQIARRLEDEDLLFRIR